MVFNDAWKYNDAEFIQERRGLVSFQRSCQNWQALYCGVATETGPILYDRRAAPRRRDATLWHRWTNGATGRDMRGMDERKQRLKENVWRKKKLKKMCRRSWREEKINEINQRTCERSRSGAELVELVERARWCIHNHLGRLKVRLLKIQLTPSLCFSLSLCVWGLWAAAEGLH